MLMLMREAFVTQKFAQARRRLSFIFVAAAIVSPLPIIIIIPSFIISHPSIIIARRAPRLRPRCCSCCAAGSSARRARVGPSPAFQPRRGWHPMAAHVGQGKGAFTRRTAGQGAPCTRASAGAQRTRGAAVARHNGLGRAQTRRVATLDPRSQVGQAGGRQFGVTVLPYSLRRQVAISRNATSLFRHHHRSALSGLVLCSLSLLPHSLRWWSVGCCRKHAVEQ